MRLSVVIIPLLLLSIFFIALAAAGEWEQQLRQCKQQCHKGSEEREEWRTCERRCEEEYRRSSEKKGTDVNPRVEEEEGERKENPYFFKEEESFTEIFRSEHGQARILKKFQDQSELLHGIANYRVVILEAEPDTFVMPSHWDADAILYVVRGRGTITMIGGGGGKKEEQQEEEERVTNNVRRGDVMGICAGDLAYMVNRDSNEKLVIAMIVRSVSAVGGEIQGFFGAGGEDPESFYRSFSEDVLEAAFNMPREKLERLFGKQKKGAIFRVSEEHIRALSRHGGGGSSERRGRDIWSEAGRKPMNLLSRKPTHSGDRGSIFEAGADDYEPLRHLDVKISFANLTAGSMIAPYYNTRATKVAIVTGGEASVEIVCPHLSSSSTERRRQGSAGGDNRGERRISYERVKSKVSRGDVIVVLPGHPTAVVASSEGEELQALCFEIGAWRNEMRFLAGRKSVVRKMEKEAKELAFDTPAREVEEVLHAQRESVFLPGPEERRRRHRPLQSILDMAGF